MKLDENYMLFAEQKDWLHYVFNLATVHGYLEHAYSEIATLSSVGIIS